MSKAYTFVVHDESVNTYGFRMLTAGANLAEFEKNPVILYNHNDWDTPIGRGENIRIEGSRILVDIIFDEEDEKGKMIAGKVDRGFLRMASVGAWPPEEVSDESALKLPGQTGVTATKWTMREISVCPIGSNHNALAMYDRSTNKRIDLSDMQGFIRLVDNCSINHKKGNNMSYLTQMLKLSDSASDQAVQEAVQGLITLRDNLQAENAGLKTQNQTLQGKVTAFETAQKEANKQKAVALVDAAVKDGRIDAKAKENWMEDFADNFDKAEVRLSSVSKRQNINAQINRGGGNGAQGKVELSDMTFEEIRQKDMIKELKKDPELYKQKFADQYGRMPN